MGRRPDKAAAERLNPDNRPKQPLGQASANERHREPKPEHREQHRTQDRRVVVKRNRHGAGLAGLSE